MKSAEELEEERMDAEEQAEERELDEQIERLRESERQAKKRQLKKKRERALKSSQRMQRSLLTPGGAGEQLTAYPKTMQRDESAVDKSSLVMEQDPMQDMELFSLTLLEKAKRASARLHPKGLVDSIGGDFLAENPAAAQPVTQSRTNMTHSDLEDEAEFEEAANALAIDERVDYEMHEERAFTERSLTREELQARIRVAYNKEEEREYEQYDEPHVSDAEEFEQHEVLDLASFINHYDLISIDY